MAVTNPLSVPRKPWAGSRKYNLFCASSCVASAKTGVWIVLRNTAGARKSLHTPIQLRFWLRALLIHFMAGAFLHRCALLQQRWPFRIVDGASKHGQKLQRQKLVTDEEAELHLIDCGHMTEGYKGTKQRSKFIVRFPNLILMVYTVHNVLYTIAMCQPVEIWNNIYAIVDILPMLVSRDYFTLFTYEKKDNSQQKESSNQNLVINSLIL